MTQALLAPIYDFLHCETPALWVDVALENQTVMLIDHANCEKKAAATAMSLMTKYLDYFVRRVWRVKNFITLNKWWKSCKNAISPTPSFHHRATPAA